MLISGVGWSRLSSIKEVRVVATFAQLHQNVLQTHLLQLASAVYYINVPHQNLSVHFTLHLAQPDVDFEFLLRLELFLHFSFQTTKKERPQDGVKTLNKSIITQAVVGIEPFIEILEK